MQNRKRDTDVKNRLLDSVGEGEGRMIWENSIERCILSIVKQIASPGCMRQVLRAGALGRPRGMGWGGRWKWGSGWGTHVNPWLFYYNVWQNSLQIKKKKRMGIPVVTREYTTGACCNSSKPMRFPPRHEMRPDSPALHAEQLRYPNQTHKEPRFVWLNSREPQQLCHQTWRTMMSPQELKIDRWAPNQIEMRPISLALAP